MARFRFDDKTIRALPPSVGANRIDYDEPPASGRDYVRGLAIRTTRAGTKTFLLVYVTHSGEERRHKIGDFGTHTVTTARKAAKDMRGEVDAGRDPFAEKRAERAHATAQRERHAATLGNLMTAYVGYLKAAGKPSWREVEAAFQRNLFDPFPKIASLPADTVSVAQVMPAFHRLTKAGSWRAAEKMRSYVFAAYAAAKAAKNDAGGFAFDGFHISSNPLAELEAKRPKEAAENAAAAARERKWALAEAQLRAYWKRLQETETPHAAMMRFHLLTGGQRMEQLSRLGVGDFDADLKTITLLDTKGRRRVAHAHVVPLLPDAMKELKAMSPKGQGPYLFSVSDGQRPAVPHTLAAAMRDVSETMIKAGEIDRTITPGAIRRTVETRLAAKGVPDEVLARLLSHGLGGVQARNYNAHHYDQEKRAALTKLRALLDLPAGKVIKFPARAG